MKIGIAAIGRLSEDTGGKNYIIHFLNELKNLDTKDSFVLFVSSGEAEPLGIKGSSQLKIVSIPSSKRTSLHKVVAEQLRLPSYITREKVDAMYYPGNFISLVSSVPSIVNIRSAAHWYGKEYGIRGLRRWVRSWLMPPGARKARAVIAPSEDIKRDVVRFAKIAPEKIHVIPHGVDVSLFDGAANRVAPESLEVLKKYDLRSGQYVLYVSALWRYKRQDQLLRAHASIVKKGFPDLKLVLAGMGMGTDKAYLEALRRLPQQLGTEGLVVFTGNLPQSSLRYLYAHANAFVFPSRYESFGNPLFEAWSSGIPVAAANVHSFPEITNGAALLFDPMKLPEIERAVLELLSNRALRDALIERGFERAKKFSWNETVRRTLRVIENVEPLSRLS